MRIGIYNRWLHTLGGGEREMAAFARVLQAEHTVDLLSHQTVDLDLFRSRLNLSLPQARQRILPLDPEYRAVAEASADYDLFVNMSHGDMLMPRARNNLLRVFFPGSATAVDAPLALLSGFYPPEEQRRRVFAWTGGEARMLLSTGKGTATGPRTLHITLHGWRPVGAAPARVRLLVDDRQVAERTLSVDGAWLDWRVRLPAQHASSEALTITLQTSTFNLRDSGTGDDFRDLGVAVADIRVATGVWSRPFARQPQLLLPDAGAYADMLARQTRRVVAGYDLLLANSRYTQQWISRRWGQSSTVLYPPIDIVDLPAGQKQQIVLSVGRFFAGNHNKKHLPMVQSFRALCDAGLRGWEYHLVGGCDKAQPEHRAYLARIQAAAEGYPIVLHVNAPFLELRKLYSAATLFWHATGFEEDEEQAPESLEHFGMVTVEAMAAGCVPVVIARAGQLEIVEPDVSGLLWETLPQLQAQTHRLITDRLLRERLATGAREQSLSFGMDHFARDVRALVAGMENRS